jgi:ADP-ribose pyrophosphatase
MPFEHLHSELIYEGHAFTVRHEFVRLPDGNQKRYDLVGHNGSVTLVPVNDKGEIYFVRQYRIGAKRHLLELPAGVLEAGEDPATGAGREVREETGMAASQLIKIGEFFMAPGYSDEFLTIFLATGLYPSPLDADPDEFLELEIIPFKQAMAMAEGGEIHDGKTLAALLLARHHLEMQFGKSN